MLKTRALTAAVLLALFGSALFFLPELGWIAFCAVLLALAVWEWGALAALTPTPRSDYTACLVLLFILPLGLGLRQSVRTGMDLLRLGHFLDLPRAASDVAQASPRPNNTTH